jgi:hypothetical protein
MFDPRQVFTVLNGGATESCSGSGKSMERRVHPAGVGLAAKPPRLIPSGWQGVARLRYVALA